MKKLISLLCVLTLTVSLSSCVFERNSSTEESSREVSETVTEAAERETDETEAEADTTEAESRKQACRKTLKSTETPETTAITLFGSCTGNIKAHAYVTDLSGVNVVDSKQTGLLGSPIRLNYDETVSDTVLMFTYDPDELRGVPEKNLIMVFYNEANEVYSVVENSSTDTEKKNVSAPVRKNGVYFIADAYYYYTDIESDLSRYEYDSDPTQYKTDWEREISTGSIMELADKEWAMKNAPYFRVSTAEELASAVYYVNGIRDEEEFVSLILEDDIDLSGYEWVPMGWHNVRSQPFRGSVDGQGHTIRGMNIDAGDMDCGFIGYGLDTDVKDIRFEDCHVSGITHTGIVGGQIYSSPQWTGISVENSTVKSSSRDRGTIIGREAALAFKDCSVENVKINGEENSYFSHRQQEVAETPVTETFKLEMHDGYVFTRDKHDGFRNLEWVFERDGVQILARLAEDERVLDAAWLFREPGTYRIYLNAYNDSTYIRVSNLIEVTID